MVPDGERFPNDRRIVGRGIETPPRRYSCGPSPAHHETNPRGRAMIEQIASADGADDTARILLRLGAVAINVQQPFVYASGITSPIYCDNRLLISHPDERERIVDALAREIAAALGPDNVDVVAGTATAGIPFAAWVADRLRKPLIYVRPNPKEHGRGRQIEGRLESGRRVVVIEDLITTGGSSLQTVEAIRRAGGLVSHCFAIFTYGFEAARRAYQRQGVVAVALTGLSSLLDLAVAERYLDEQERQQVVAWLASQPAT
jgi:orotate phosphoribosyltransferase